MNTSEPVSAAIIGSAPLVEVLIDSPRGSFVKVGSIGRVDILTLRRDQKGRQRLRRFVT